MQLLYMYMGLTVIAVIIAVALVIKFGYLFSGGRMAGKRGEQEATWLIKQILGKEDYIFTNVKMQYEDKVTELDNVIVNKYGVFIIEVKNYKGVLYGNEDDFEWKKLKDDGHGNTFEMNVKNPIKQVRRQIYILAKHLEQYGCGVYVKGYAILVNNNSPVESKFVLSDSGEIDKALHTPGKTLLTAKQIKSIVKLLQ